MTKHKARKKGRKRRLATKIHRWTGVASLLIVLVVAVTGILLNHTESLKLNERRVTSGPVLRHYGLVPAGNPEALVRTGDHLLAVWDGQAIFDQTAIDEVSEAGELIGAGRVGGGEFAFVFPSLVVVCGDDSGLLDRLDEASLPPGRIARAGEREGTLVLELESGGRFAMRDWIEAVPDTGPDPTWFARAEAPITAAERDVLAAAFRGEGLPLSRILLDFHSGRFFGIIGVIVYDLAAVTLVLLGITGTVLWVRRRK